MIEATVEALIEEFRPTSSGATPWDAVDQCYRESTRFARMMIERGYQATVISGYRFGTCLGNRVVEAGHCAVLLADGNVIDWTARQFWGGRFPSDDAPAWPLIQPHDEWRESWPTIT